MDDETYNGWTNRETWALMLHIGNDPGLYKNFRIVARAYTDEPERMDPVDAVEREATALLDPDEYREAFGEPQPEALARVARDVGSLWRVNWREVVDALIEE